MVRMPEGMRESIQDAAKANNRSMNAEIVARLESSSELDAKVAEMKALAEAHSAAAASLSRLLKITAFYLKECAERVPKDTPETKVLMDNIALFAAGVHAGDLKSTIGPVQAIVDLQKLGNSPIPLDAP
jgi:hypothetical protein